MASVDITNHDITALGLWDVASTHHVARGMGGTMTLDPSMESLSVIGILETIGSISVELTPAPVCTSDPEISGTAEVGQTLTLDPGVWERADSLAYQWEIGGEPVEGATDITLVVPPESVGWVTASVTATGPGGVTVAEADQYGPIAG